MKLNAQAIVVAAQVGEDIAETQDVGDYGYGGEIYPHYIVTNWLEVAEAIIRAYKEEVKRVTG